MSGSKRARPQIMRPWEWSVPPRPVHLEVLSAAPATATGRPPLLFVPGLGHGAWCYAEHWLDAAAARGFEAHAVSLRGHGGSGGHTSLARTTARGYVHDLLQAIAALPAPPVIVSHSLGALPVRQVLARYPARAGVLVAPFPARGLRASLALGARRKPVAAARAAVGGSLKLTAADLFTDLDPGRAEGYVSRIGRESPWAQLAMAVPGRLEPIDVPMLVVGTADDALLARSDLDRAAREVDAPVRIVPGGHDVMLDGHWREGLDVILDWIDATCPPDSPALPGAAALPPLTDVLGPGGRS